jgi:hypothetical protein
MFCRVENAHQHPNLSNAPMINPAVSMDMVRSGGRCAAPQFAR